MHDCADWMGMSTHIVAVWLGLYRYTIRITRRYSSMKLSHGYLIDIIAMLKSNIPQYPYTSMWFNFVPVLTDPDYIIVCREGRDAAVRQ